MEAKGVVSTEVGFMGGTKEYPTYKEVCGKRTGHAEVVHLLFDPDQVSYEALLSLFFRIHDPTQLNRQGPDYGDQYRSVIFYYDEEQKRLAEEAKGREGLGGKHAGPVVTQIVPATRFWRAEEYHQKYFQKNKVRSCGI
ncbi:MAG: peptide-methionine (S)-S-oxide reductase MsrA [Methanomassiliicoccales archaeon]|nr:peptide-methionine (S)-S-oxide reductase MsrA [Methanomassiliicoccales archaeon]